MLEEFVSNVTHNLFKPLLLFFYAGFLVPALGVKLEFPKAAYQALTIYLLLAIGWHGGEELASLEPELYLQAAGFMIIGFCMNAGIALVAYFVLRWMTKLRQVDAATVAGYYGSDSAGTFVTCLGVLTAAQIAFAPFMPVLLAVMEVPGCLVALYLVSKLRQSGMDSNGNMPGEVRDAEARSACRPREAQAIAESVRTTSTKAVKAVTEQRVLVGAGSATHSHGQSGYGDSESGDRAEFQDIEEDWNDDLAHQIEELRGGRHLDRPEALNVEKTSNSWLNREMLHEVFLNPGIFLLFGGIAIGFLSRLQGETVTVGGDALFNTLFQGCLCLFLLEMGITASSKLKDLRAAGWQFVLFALIAPNVFATSGMIVAHLYSLVLGQPFELGTYVLFAVLCGAASYIAVPAVQRLAIPEASPTLPLAASLGVTFSYNVTLGIPMYLLIAQVLTKTLPIYAAT